ncbi:MAG TPA: trehalase family glycosidase [Terracidiphilus sp.]|nr:trehalase family glycosidase [Terracidiphilus sp.]
MKLVVLVLSVLEAILLAPAQTIPAASSAPKPDTAAAPQSTPILDYIQSTWTTLTRSMTQCASLVDIKVSTTPVLYLPAEFPTPPAVLAMQTKCKVNVLHLPHTIQKIGEINPRNLPQQGLLYLPNSYVVPGGQFNEMYGWDSYFIILGLEADHRESLAKGMVDNFLFEIEHYGGILNANRTYYLTRSQPPFLTSMIRAVYEDPISFPRTPEGRAEKRSWLAHAYTLAQKDYSYWLRPEHAAGYTRLARYYDYGSGPVPEMSNADTYYQDVIHWVVDHPGQASASFLIKAPEHPDAAEAARLKTTSCDMSVSELCAHAWYGGYRLSRSFYIGDRAMRESGFDPSFRFGPFSGATEDYAPVGLNCLLYRYARDMEHFALLLDMPAEAQRWNARAIARDSAIHQYLWRPNEGVFADYDFVHHRPSNYAFITWLYPLWTGVATQNEAKQIVAKLSLLERPGGLSTSNYQSGLQWDDPYGWAPTNWIGIEGLEDTGFREDALRIARHFSATIGAGFAADGSMVEKYDVAAGNAQVKVTAGYKINQVGFGWTNAIYLKMHELIEDATPLLAAPQN